MPEITSARYVLCIRAAARGGAVAEAQRRPSLRAMVRLSEVEVDAVDQLRAHERDVVVAKGPCTRSRARKHTHLRTHTHTTHTHEHKYTHTYIHTQRSPASCTQRSPTRTIYTMTVITENTAATYRYIRHR